MAVPSLLFACRVLGTGSMVEFWAKLFSVYVVHMCICVSSRHHAGMFTHDGQVMCLVAGCKAYSNTIVVFVWNVAEAVAL